MKSQRCISFTDTVNSNGSGDMTDVVEDDFKDRHSSELPCVINSAISNSGGNNFVNGNHPNNENENELATSVESESDSDNATKTNKPLPKEDQLVITQTKYKRLKILNKQFPKIEAKQKW